MAVLRSLASQEETHRPEARLLCVGDLHLGRRPSGLPDDLGGLRPEDLTPSAGWQAAVQHAIRSEVDAVLLAGDVVESPQDRFRAFGRLESGVRELLARGIPVFAVAGNHDVAALPRLAERIEGFRLLGSSGRWEEAEVPNRAGIRMRLIGWSFPTERVTGSPLAELRFRREEGAVAIGLLHADVDGSRGPYAPVRRRELESSPADAWLLGHVHRPDPLAAMGRPIGYLGSLCPLDPGEPGPHGPWLLRIRGPGALAMEHVRLSPLRYERIDVPLEPLDEGEGDLADRLLDAVRGAIDRLHARTRGEPDSARLVGCRVRLGGRCREHGELAGLSDDVLRSLRLERDGVAYFVEGVQDEGAPAIDLERLAEGSDPPGILAGLLRAIEREEPEGRRLIERARRKLGEEARRARWSDLEEEDIDARGILLRAGMRALEGLLAQRRRDEGKRR